ncbi:MAG: 4-alpha-glucanotransferase [Fimbriiglobus sp.]
MPQSGPTFAPRSSGILLHPSSLPGPFGIGDLGPEAYRWILTLQAMKQTWWQILPLGPTGAGNSPYQSFSAFAGNIALLSPEMLQRDGLLPNDYPTPVGVSDEQVQYGVVLPAKAAMLRAAWGRYRGGGAGHLRHDFEVYQDQEKSWLEDYATFMAIREALGGRSLADWPKEVRERQPIALGELERTLADEILMHRFGQFLFDRQWMALKRYAHEHGVKIIGDAPIFVAMDSADVWANPGEFLLDSELKPSAVAGVPPDYFSPTGQHWGNPLYDWAKMAETGFRWWIARVKRNLAQVDLVRLDHFRGFAAAWHIPAGETTAMNGQWVDGPRGALFEALEKALGKLAIIAEDLGLITDDVHELRLKHQLPGMRVLQFMLGGPENPYWPHNYDPLTVCYTGTHDNNTTNGWFTTLNDHDRERLAQYLGHGLPNPADALVRLAWSSTAILAVAPLQDILGLGGEARMNVPGVADGNWGWRFQAHLFPQGTLERVAEWTRIYHRIPG